MKILVAGSCKSGVKEWEHKPSASDSGGAQTSRGTYDREVKTHSMTSRIPPFGAIGALFPLSRFELEAWRKLTVRERFAHALDLWASGGFATPFAIHLLYAVKLVLYLASIIALESHFGKSATPTAHTFQRFTTFNLLWESLGLGCGSGPLSAHFFPPFTAFIHWFKVGSLKVMEG